MDSFLVLVFGSYLVPGSIDTMSETYQGEKTVCQVKVGDNGRHLAGRTLIFKDHSCNEVTKEMERVATNYSRGEYKIGGYAGIN